jgi:hypothetical protein
MGRGPKKTESTWESAGGEFGGELPKADSRASIAPTVECANGLSIRQAREVRIFQDMKTPIILAVTAAALAMALPDRLHSQSAASGDVEAHHDYNSGGIPNGVLRVNGVLYIVNGGVARRIDLADGQMANMDGVIGKLPKDFVVSKLGATPAGTPMAPTGTTDRQRAVKGASQVENPGSQ